MSVMKFLLMLSVLLHLDIIDAKLSTKVFRNTWETAVATDIMTLKLKVISTLSVNCSIKH